LVKQYAIDETRVSKKSLGVVKAYGANTHKGIIRNYNEDRVSIVTNFGRDRSMLFFAVYDGHGGNICADYLKDNMHLLVSEQLSLTNNIKEALAKAIDIAESNVLKNSELMNDFSGSCALIAIIRGIFSLYSRHYNLCGNCKRIPR
jgi:protein phosphatase 2C family protein 2/3